MQPDHAAGHEPASTVHVPGAPATQATVHLLFPTDLVFAVQQPVVSKTVCQHKLTLTAVQWCVSVVTTTVNFFCWDLCNEL